ncbi:MAG: helix-turn-helix transcriptional regulator [Rhodocyclaceae bacterium]|nr:helix-turn-helix transcriptional regulator [Rhodocyclaceae bacterium]MDP1958115.1 helix-turn-helix transcriptional regulator [Rhodocyclaceae bacterium]
MNAPTNFQTILGEDGKPAFVVVPYEQFRRMSGGFTPGTIPHAVVSAEVDGASSAKAWREYLRLTQAEVAARMGVSQAAYAQMEAAKRPRKPTLAKIAAALGLEVEQLAL